MRTTIDAAGRLVIPKQIREQAGLRPGMPLEISYRDGAIEIEPAPMPVRLVRKGHLTVAVPAGDVPTLTADQVERAREQIRGERGRGRPEA
jgi:AbrB family looped-hinge helix DNA binding protein